MATNNKYYQSLLDKGYTQQEIDQMINAVSSGQNATDVVKNMNSQKSGSTSTSNTTNTTNTTNTSTTSTPKTSTSTTTSAPTYTPTPTNNNLGNWSYGDDSAERQQQIINNLNNAYNKNPTQFSSWDTFANAFNYNYSGRSDKERETMRNWYENKFWTTQNQTPTVNKSVSDATYDKNGNLHITYMDGSTEIIPWWTWTQQGVVGGSTGLSADGKTYTFQPWYTPIYPEGETAWDKSTSVANLGKLQQKSKTLTYQEDSQARYDQILGNLERIYLSNPEYFTDRTTFDANFQIDQRSVWQQQLMVEWFYAKKKQERDLNAISGLKDGQSIWDAINNGSLTYDQLALLEWTPQYDQYLSITKDKVNLATINNDPAMFFINNIPATLEDLKEEIMATLWTMDEYNMWEYMLSLYDGEDYERVRDRVESSTQEALLIKAEYDSIDSNVRNRLEGTGATKAYINAVIAREQNDLIPRVNTAYAQLQADQTNYQLRHQSVVDKYQSYYDQAHYEIEKYNAQVNAFQTMWWVYRDVAQYDWEYKQQYRLLKLEESYNNPMLDSDDPDEAKRALKQTLQGYYDTYGQIIQRDINQVIQDVYAYAKKNWVSLATALQKNFVDQLKKKPEYKELTKQYMYGREYLYQKAWTAWSSSSSSSSSASGGTSGVTWWATPTASWWQQTSGVTPTSLDQTEVEKVLNWFSNQYKDGNTGGQCGHFVNQYLDKLWFWLNNLWDSISQKASLINDDTPSIGSIVVMDSKVAPENGHVAIVVGINPENGNLIVKDSNRKSDGIIHTHEISSRGKNIRGYINPAKALSYKNYSWAMPNTEIRWGNGQAFRLNEYGYIDELADRYKYYIEHWEIASTASGSQSLLSAYGMNEAQFSQQASNFAKYWPEAQSYLGEIVDMYGLITKLADWIGGLSWNDLWTGDWMLWKQNYDYLVNQLTLSYFTQLKAKWATFWQMSNAEWDMVKEASTQLWTYLNSFTKELLFNQNKDWIASLLYDMATRYERLIRWNPVYQNNVYNRWGSSLFGNSSTSSSGGSSSWQSGFTTNR